MNIYEDISYDENIMRLPTSVALVNAMASSLSCQNYNEITRSFKDIHITLYKVL
jgi:hypothetical protein